MEAEDLPNAALLPSDASQTPKVLHMALKAQPYANVYLLLLEGARILLSLRENTGWGDGQWSLVAGHIDAGEPAAAAMVREAAEEAGIQIDPCDLEVVHVMHRLSNRENIDIFMRCTRWTGTLQNTEPHKCGGLAFYPLDSLPTNLIDYVREAVDHIQQKRFYSEFGW